MPVSALLYALFTIFLWSFLAFFGSRLSHVPPFLLVGLALCISGLAGLIRMKDWRVPWQTLAVGVGGIFGYHFLYFSAFRYAPAVEANMINYLWPLLIVLLTPVYLPGNSLHAQHLIGAAMGLAGSMLIITGGSFSLDLQNLPGYLLAAGAAVTWASYSLLTRRLRHFPTGTVGAFCLFSGLLSLSLFGLESWATRSPLPVLTTTDWIYLILIGLGPMGLAFFTWDAALKHGDPRIIGALTYMTPLSSTFVLVVLGGRSLSGVSAVALAFILGGVLVSSAGMLRKKPAPTENISG
ncbi:MAG TPA: DMT family transporter [Anaerolineaceae bacterium]|nr:DMT family transporter [Anaerolineaceae bacterium]